MQNQLLKACGKGVDFPISANNYGAAPATPPPPPPIMPVTPPPRDSATLPTGSEYYCADVIQTFRTGQTGRHPIDLNGAIERYEETLRARRAAGLRNKDSMIGMQEARRMAEVERLNTPKPSAYTVARVKARTEEIERAALGKGEKISLFAAVAKAVDALR